MSHILIIDAGSTKTNFALLNLQDCDNQDVVPNVSYKDQGINPNYSSENEIMSVFSNFVQKNTQNIHIDQIFYYGSGCANEINAEKLRNLISLYYPTSDIFVYSDLLAACRALSGNSPSIVGILGTGAATCRYDGEKIANRAPSLGYLLGDEGSGTYLGKQFLKYYLSDKLPAQIAADFEVSFNINKNTLLYGIYQEAHPNNFFASIPPFIKRNSHFSAVKDIICDSFLDFFRFQKDYYKTSEENLWHFTGSIAANFQTQLTEAAIYSNVRIGKIIANPMPSLIKYHCNKNERNSNQ